LPSLLLQECPNSRSPLRKKKEKTALRKKKEKTAWDHLFESQPSEGLG
jgi:hypothetical protein